MIMDLSKFLMRIILTNNRSDNFVFLIMAIGQQLPNLDFKMIRVFFSKQTTTYTIQVLDWVKMRSLDCQVK